MEARKLAGWLAGRLVAGNHRRVRVLFSRLLKPTCGLHKLAQLGRLVLRESALVILYRLVAVVQHDHRAACLLGILLWEKLEKFRPRCEKTKAHDGGKLKSSKSELN